MGASLARAAQWTTASDTGKGKLELSPLNEKLLSDIIQVSSLELFFKVIIKMTMVYQL